MKLLNPEIIYLNQDFREQVAATAPCFLNQLEGLTVFDIQGHDTSRTRVVTTLIHGNEPSGFIACHLWLLSGVIPATNVRLIFCNPESAQQIPIFTRRYINECEDLNRYFGDKPHTDSTVQQRANLIKQAIIEVNPEAIIDLHNTSGSSGAFGVTNHGCQQIIQLTGLFARTLIYTDLQVGALMEYPFEAPIVTIECGGATELTAHQVATIGLNAYFMHDQIFIDPIFTVEIHQHPIRIELVGDASISYANHRLLTTDITLIPELEQFNRQLTPKGQLLGWYYQTEPLPMQAIDHQQVNQIHKLFEVVNGCIYSRCEFQLFMATTNIEIATNDCIAYVTFAADDLIV